ncbi:hypothetical protein IH799_01115 [candidate division KSB1 bacterium]|nr:hypothetical protein [candidate division KSB1 bacterium]
MKAVGNFRPATILTAEDYGIIGVHAQDLTVSTQAQWGLPGKDRLFVCSITN